MQLNSGTEPAYPPCPTLIDKGQGVRAVIGGRADDVASGLPAAGIAPFGGFNSSNPTAPNVALAFVRSPLNSPRAELRTVREIADTVSHEIGHTMLLSHTALYENGIFNCDLGPGNSTIDSIMSGLPKRQEAVVADRTTWRNEQVQPLLSKDMLEEDKEEPCERLQRSTPGFVQDDMRILASTQTSDLPHELLCTAPSSQPGCQIFVPNGFGYRPDDHANSAGNASRMVPVGNGAYEQIGIIEQTDDIDYFRFLIPTGIASKTPVTAVVRVGRMFPEDDSDKSRRTSPNLNAHLSLFDGTGTHVIVQNGSTGRDGLDARVSAQLPPGEYTLAVRSHNKPGDSGRYSLELKTRDGLSIISALPMPDRLSVEFNQSIDLASFQQPVDVKIEDGEGSVVPPEQIRIRQIENSLRHFDVMFPPYKYNRGIDIGIGPDITTANGNPMDQSGDGPIGDDPEDVFRFEDHIPPEVTGITLMSSGFTIDFSEPIQASSFRANHIWLRGPGGLPINPLHGDPRALSQTRFFVPMRSYPNGGVTIVINAGIRDWYGNESANYSFPLIQDTGGPRVIQATPYSSAQPGGGVSQLDTIILAFSELMSVDSVSVASGKINVAYLDAVSTPALPSVFGTPIHIRDIALYQAPGLGQNHPQYGRIYKVTFEPVGFGRYALTVDSFTTDIFGNAMDQDTDGLNGELVADEFRYEFEITPLLQP